MSEANPLEQHMLNLINQERAAVGAPPLVFDGNLNQSSEQHSQWMLEQDQFQHAGDGGSTAQERMAEAGYPFEGAWRSGENIAFQSLRGEPGLLDDVEDLHNSLMNSPGHRANILNPEFTEIGIGLEEGVFTDSGRDFDSLMVTQNFATTDAVLDAPSTPPVDVPVVDAAPVVIAEIPVEPDPVPVVEDVPAPSFEEEAPDLLDEDIPEPIIAEAPAATEDVPPVIPVIDMADPIVIPVMEETPDPVTTPVSVPMAAPEPEPVVDGVVMEDPVPTEAPTFEAPFVDMMGPECPAPFMLTDDLVVQDTPPSAGPDVFVFSFEPIETPAQFIETVTDFLSDFFEFAFDQFEESAPDLADTAFDTGPLWLGEWIIELG